MQLAFKNNSKQDVARTRVVHYGLVMDKARIDLAAGFRARVAELRDVVLTEERNLIHQDIRGFMAALDDFALGPVDAKNFAGDLETIETLGGKISRASQREAALLDEYGTHYPYAVTYGGMAFAEAQHVEFEVSTGQQTDNQVKASAKGIVDEMLELGIKGSAEWGSGTSSSSGTGIDATFVGTYGGSIARGGGWTLTRGEEVPLLLDLRPLHELLSPIYFQDPWIWAVLRQELKSRLDFDAYSRVFLQRAASDDNLQRLADLLKRVRNEYP
jgi:hypothetical protein